MPKLDPPFSGHGIFTSLAIADTIGGSTQAKAKAFAQRIADAGFSHLWVRIHGYDHTNHVQTIHDKYPTQYVIDELRLKQINVAGWGWCQGADPELEAKTALKALDQFGLDYYIADIEHEVHNTDWSTDKIKTFFEALKAPDATPKIKQVLISSHGFIAWHKPELMKKAAAYVDGFAPQIYWQGYPDANILNVPFLHGKGYHENNAPDYANACIDAWLRCGDKPIVMTGQAYWGEKWGAAQQVFTQPEAEQKLTEFLGGFTAWNRICALNWWHAGENDSVGPKNAWSIPMRTALKNADIH